MAKFTMEETGSGDFLTLPEDTIIHVVVESTEIRDQASKDGSNTWKKLNFKFKILELPSALEGEFGVLVGTPIFGSVSAKLTTHPDNKLRQWAEALLDLGELDAGFELDTDMLVGRKARAVVDNYVKRDGTVGQGVKGLLPLAPASVGSSGSSSAASDLWGDEPPF